MRNKNLKRVLSLVCAVALLLGMGIMPNSFVYAEESATASEMPSETDTNTGDNEITSDELLNSTGSDGEEEPSAYREVTFSDFGIEDQTIPSGYQISGVLSDVENLDGVAFTGKLRMGLCADMYHSFRLGGKDGDANAQWSGVGLWTEASTQLAGFCYTGVLAGSDIVKIPVADYGITYDEATGYSEFKLRIIFDYIDGTSDVKITISINDLLAYDGTLADAQNYFGNQLHLWTNGGKTITVASVVAGAEDEEEESATYREVTFSDFGIYDQTIASGTQLSGTLSDVENLDGVAFTGKMRMGLHADMYHSFRLGGKEGDDNSRWSGVGLWTENSSQLAVNYYVGVIATNGDIVKLPVANYGITYDEATGYSEFKLRIIFDYIDGTSNIKITISVNDILAYDGILTDAQNYFGNRLHLWANGGQTITVKSVDVDAPTYQEVTFSDFGIENQTISAVTQLSGALSDVDNLDGVAFTGYMQMGLCADMYHSFRLGGKEGDDNSLWSGVGLWTEANSQLSVFYYTGVLAGKGDIVKLPIANYGITYDEATGFSEFKLRMTFEYIDGTSDIKLTISINDMLAYAGVLADAQNYFGNQMHLWANGGKDITVRSVPDGTEEEPVTYHEVSFSDFGIFDQTLPSGTQLSGALSDVENLDGVAFTGNIQMGLHADMYHSFRLGGKEGDDNSLWSGVGLWTENSNQLAVSYYTGVIATNGDIVKIPVADYGVTYDEATGYSEFKIRLTFDYIDGTSDIQLTISINDILAYDGVLTDAQNYFGNQLHLWANGGKTIAVKSVDVDPAIYQEVTFSDFGIEDQTIPSGNQPSGILSGVETLDGVAFTGYLQMGLHADMYHSFRLGGKEGDDNSSWSGVGLWTESSNQLAVSYYTGVIATNGDIVKLPIANYGITYDEATGYSEFKIRMTFDYIEGTSDIKLTISINDMLAYVGILTDAQNYFGNQLHLWANGGKTIKVTSVGNGAEEDPEDGKLDVSGISVTLHESISMNFHVALNSAENSQMQITVGSGDPVLKAISEAEKDSGGNYIFVVDLAAAQLTDTVTLQLVTDGVAGDLYTTTGRDYAEKVLADEQWSAYHEVVKHMLNYGAAAQVYFKYNDTDLANKNYKVDAVEIPAGVPAVEVSGNVSGITFYGATLLFKSKTAVRFYFTGSSEGISFGDYEAVPKDGMYYVEIADINPQNLDEVIELVVSDAAGNKLTVAYSPMHYIKRMYYGNGSAELKAVLQAMYGYYLAAENITAA